VHLEADATRLAQVLANLLNNAAKYTEPGGHIAVLAQRREDRIDVTVRDDGIGIDREMLPRVFDLFAQVVPGAQSSRGGLGIGLSLARTLVEMHGGRIEACSAGLGKGSEFVVSLPAAAPKPSSRLSAIAAGERVAPARRRVLIVDDLKDSADTLAELMRMKGHEVHTAYDGDTAITLAKELRPEVMLLDIGMPGLNGYQVCREIRQRAGGDELFLIAVTGWGHADDRMKTIDVGFDRHLVKPIDGLALGELIASLPLASGNGRPNAG